MGLGSAAAVSLKEARDAADEARKVVRMGGDPIKERQKRRRAAARNLHLLEDVAKDAFNARKGELKNDGIAGRWWSPIALHILPKLGKTPVADIGQADIRDTLKPIWNAKAETAQKALRRLNIVFKHAAALGLDVDLQTVTKARILLGKSLHDVAHIPAMNWRDVPSFYASLSDESTTHLAMRLLILTGVRSGPLRFAKEEQIVGDVWTIPAGMMKGRRGQTEDFRVPISDEALKIVTQARCHAREGFLFPNVRQGVISDATLSRFMERRGLDARPHGFRSSLRDWLAEASTAPREVAETILAHVAGSQTELAYRRTDFLEQRRVLMQLWADHVTGRAGNVLQFATG